jgi:UDP-glucose 4-epimerase
MSSPYTTACVTGGAGFIGAHLVRALLARDMTVNVLDNLCVGKATTVPAGARLIVGDILDPVCLGDALAGCEVVFHLAARVAIRASFAGVVEDTTTNVVGTASVLQAARTAGVRKVITTSSMAVYADAVAPLPLDEHSPTEPISPYGISKLAAERLTHTMCARAGMQSVALRLFNTYGPGQTLSPYVGVVTIFVNALRQGKAPTIFGDGAQCRDFVHVVDVVQGFLAALEAEVSGETFNIGSGVPTSVNTVLHHINRVMHTALAGQYVEAAAGELRYSLADISKARRMLGYAPRYSFATSIETVVRDILEMP